jgi:hypothetical protein
MARVVQPGGRLILGLDNLAPALRLYGYWLVEKITNYELRITNTELQTTPSTGQTHHTHPTHQPAADATLWQRRANPLVWHGRGLLRSLRWRTWPGWVDAVGRAVGLQRQPGDVNVAQFSQPATPGTVYYHIYQADELLADAAAAGWQLLAFHNGSELNTGKSYPARVRGLDKQLFFAFEKG